MVFNQVIPHLQKDKAWKNPFNLLANTSKSVNCGHSWIANSNSIQVFKLEKQQNCESSLITAVNNNQSILTDIDKM